MQNLLIWFGKKVHSQLRATLLKAKPKPNYWNGSQAWHARTPYKPRFVTSVRVKTSTEMKKEHMAQKFGQINQRWI